VAHPDELEHDSRGKTYSISFASEKGFAAIESAYHKIVDFVEEAPYAGNIVGYNLFLEYEGHPWGSQSIGAYTDTSPAMQEAFQLFLKNRYKTDAALKSAWGSPRQVFMDGLDELEKNWRQLSPEGAVALARCRASWDNPQIDHAQAMEALRDLWTDERNAFENVLSPYARRGVLPEPTLANATIPTPNEFLGGDQRYIFQHPRHSRKVRDYLDLLEGLVIKRHRQVARAVRKASGNRKLVGLMGGYSLIAGQPRSIISTTGFPEVQLSIQHFFGPGYFSRAFEISEIDFYFSPTDYLNTGMGGVCLVLHTPASLKLHGKVAWVEDDQRTHLHDHWSWNPGLHNAYESTMVHRRNMALLYTEAGAHDWMEMIQKWLLQKDILKNIGDMDRELKKSVNVPYTEPDAICVLFDEESQGWTKPTTHLDELLFWQQRNSGLSYAGVPVRYHLLSDLEHDDFPAYKTYILPNACHITPQKEVWLSKIRRDGNVLVWIYGAGYVGETSLSVDGMTQVTGMQIQEHNVVWEHRVGITNFDHPITRNLPANLTWGAPRHYAPIFRVEDPEAIILGRSFGNAMTRSAGLAIREFGQGARGAHKPDVRLGPGDYASIYCEAPNLPAELIREIARYGGAHIYLETNDFLLSGRDIVMVHSAKPGPRVLKLTKTATVTEIFSGHAYGKDVDEIPFEIDPRGGTQVFRLQ